MRVAFTTDPVSLAIALGLLGPAFREKENVDGEKKSFVASDGSLFCGIEDVGRNGIVSSRHRSIIPREVAQ